MAIVLSKGSAALTLPDGLYWSDEHNWQPVVQSAEYSLTGALIVESAIKLAGRPITLTADEDRAWMPRSDLDTLYAWASSTPVAMTLIYHGRTASVIFRHNDPPAIQARPLWETWPPAGTDWLIATIKLMEL